MIDYFVTEMYPMNHLLKYCQNSKSAHHALYFPSNIQIPLDSFKCSYFTS